MVTSSDLTWQSHFIGRGSLGHSNISIIIEIYKINNSNKPTLAASSTDNDKNCLFSTIVFQEALYHFESTEGDPFHVLPYTVEEISKCQNGLRHQIKDLPEYINVKINFIKKTWKFLYWN